MGKKTGALLLLMLITASICTGIQYNNVGTVLLPRGSEQAPWVYGRDWLLSLRRKATPEPEPGLLEHVPEELLQRRGERKPRKRGKRGGIQQRLRRRCNKPPLPSILLSNARSLRNKMEELRLNARVCHEYRESCLMVFTESWLQDDFPDELIQVPGFTTVRMDRNANSGKRRGGGICMYIRDAWCGNYTIKDTVCSPDLELLCLSLRPFHLPRDYGNIFICAVYIPPSGNASRAATRIAEIASTSSSRTSRTRRCLLWETSTTADWNMPFQGFSNTSATVQGRTIYWTNVTVILIMHMKPESDPPSQIQTIIQYT